MQEHHKQLVIAAILLAILGIVLGLLVWLRPVSPSLSTTAAARGPSPAREIEEVTVKF